MKLEEIKKELDQLNIDDVEELLQYIKDNKLINDYTSIILEALEYKYSDSFIPEFATLFTIIKLLLKTKFIGLFIIFRLFYIDF